MTGNILVDEISQLNINSIPEAWYLNIRKGTTPNSLAILVLWDIIYWYKWTEIRDEQTGLLTRYKKKFSDKDWLQRSNEQIGKKFGISKKVARETLDFLENLGLIKREYKTLHTEMGNIPNVMYIAVCPDVIKQYSFQLLSEKNANEKPVNEEENSSQLGTETVPGWAQKQFPVGHGDSAQLGSTTTTNTTTNTTVITTSDVSSDSFHSSLDTSGDTHERAPLANKTQDTLNDTDSLTDKKSQNNTEITDMTVDDSETQDYTDTLTDKDINKDNPLADKIQDKQDFQDNTDNGNPDEETVIFPWDVPEFMESAGFKKAAEYTPDGNKPKKKRKPRIPLAEREPVNDIERVEKAYMKALEDAEKKMPGITEKSYSGFRNIGCQRKRINEWLKDYSAAEMETAIRLAVNDSFCTGQLNMVFSSILSDKVFLRLLHGNIKPYESQRKFPARPKESFVDGDRDYSNVTDW